MRKSMLMAGLLLATLYACNQEEEALKTLKPTDGGEVMVTASGTLTPAELLAQDSLMTDYYRDVCPFDDPNLSVTTFYFHNSLLLDSSYHDGVYSQYQSLTTGHSGFNGMSETQIDDLISDAFDIIVDGIIGVAPTSPGDDYDTWDQEKRYRRCLRRANRKMTRARGKLEAGQSAQAINDQYTADLKNCCDNNPKACDS